MNSVKESTSIRSLVKSLCANYSNHYNLCLPLDSSCYMLNGCSSGKLCKYFAKSVLPNDPVLELALTGKSEGIKKCAVCQKDFNATGNKSKYCPDCVETVRKKKKAEYERNRRLKRGQIELEKARSNAGLLVPI